MKSTVDIECPSCALEHQIDLGKELRCAECNESFSGHYFQKAKIPIATGISALLLGGFGNHYMEENVFSESRYPLEVEYEIVQSCSSSSSLPMNSRYQEQKTKVCICALEKTTEEIRYDDFKEGESDFLTHFRRSVNACSS